MEISILHIEVDVDDKNFNEAVFNSSTGKIRNFECKPDISGLMEKFKLLMSSAKLFVVTLTEHLSVRCSGRVYVFNCLNLLDSFPALTFMC